MVRSLVSENRMSANHTRLAELIETKLAVIGVIGLGYVGLPLIRAFTGAGFRVNGRLEPHTLPVAVDTRGRSMSHYPYGKYVVRANEVWLYSPYHPQSFDSRYFGPVSMASVRSEIVPLWTF